MTSELVDVFQFMAIRAGEKLNKSESRKGFIRDENYYYGEGHLPASYLSSAPTSPATFVRPTGINDVDLFSKLSESQIGKFVYTKIIEGTPNLLNTNVRKPKSFRKSLEDFIIDGVQTLLVSGYTYTSNGGDVQIPPVVKLVSLDQDMNPQDGFLLGMASERKTYRYGTSICILPDNFAEIVTPLTTELTATLKLSQQLLKTDSSNAQASRKLDLENLLNKIAQSFGLESSDFAVTSIVFDIEQGRYTSKFAFTKRILFDTLYGLYILRKRQSLSLEPVIDGLRACHLLEALAISDFFSSLIKNKKYPDSSSKFVDVLSATYPLLDAWKPDSQTASKSLESIGLKIIDSLDEIQELLLATPIVNPIFARLKYTFEPFNSIVPIGIGDLKVVKQKFLGYKKGEIAHIETVLSSETKTRVHRSLEKTEDSFSIASSNDTETTKDSQSTARFELKNEAEEAIKSDLGINVNTGLTYKGNPMLDASVTAGMTYANSKTTSDKSSKNFVNEVIAKATSRVQSKVSQQRTQIRQLEIEETNTHSFINTSPGANISGMYQWLEKVYEAQIHNYGKRLMFEFILPEPAEFFVESRLYANAASLDLPKYPEKINTSTATTPAPLPVSNAAQITEDLFNNVLSKKYRLEDLPPPPASIDNVPIVNGKQGGVNFTKTRAYNDTGLLREDYDNSSVTGSFPLGYTFSGIRVVADMWFRGKGESEPNWQNTLQIFLDDQIVFDKVDETLVHWVFDLYSVMQMPSLASTTFNISIGTKTCDRYTLQFYMSFQRDSATFADWQTRVFERISTSPPIPSDSDASTSDQDFQTKLIEYQKKLNDIKAGIFNEIIQGKSSQWNQDTINCELKRQCISMIAKEFDADRSDDIISSVEATKKIGLDVYFPVLDVMPGHLKDGSTTDIVEANANYEDKKDNPLPTFSFLDVDESRRKGKYIQFLEQAFEWNQLSYIFYPYFWASIPKWVELMSRDDQSDPMFTKFLQAGSAKALLAVTPGYENAVLHFLTTREPWEGGPSPVIGDPLYIPLYEEVRNQQDDLSGSVPVGDPWKFTLPTSLIYLESDKYPLVNEYKEV